MASYIPPFDAMVLAESVDTLNLSADLTVKLKGGKVESLLDVTKRSERDYFRIPTFNKKNLLELRASLQARKLFLRPLPPKEEVAEGLPKEQKQLPKQDKAQQPKQNDFKANNKPMQKPTEQKQGDKQANKPMQKQGEFKQGAKLQPTKQGQKAPAQQPKQDNNKFQKDKQKQKNKKLKQEDFVTEAKTKAEREKLRPKKPAVVTVSDIYVKINKNGKWGFIHRKTNKVVVEPKYDEVFAYKEDICCVELDGKFGYIDRNGEEIIPLVYEVASSFSEGYASVCKNGAYGYINPQNEVVVDFKFSAGTAVIDNNCRVKKDGKWGEMVMDNVSEIRWIV